MAVNVKWGIAVHMDGLVLPCAQSKYTEGGRTICAVRLFHRKGASGTQRSESMVHCGSVHESVSVFGTVVLCTTFEVLEQLSPIG